MNGHAKENCWYLSNNLRSISTSSWFASRKTMTDWDHICDLANTLAFVTKCKLMRIKCHLDQNTCSVNGVLMLLGELQLPDNTGKQVLPRLSQHMFHMCSTSTVQRSPASYLRFKQHTSILFTPTGCNLQSFTFYWLMCYLNSTLWMCLLWTSVFTPCDNLSENDQAKMGGKGKCSS